MKSSESGKESAIKQAFAIAYSLMRLAESRPDSPMAKALGGRAFELIDLVSNVKSSEALEAVDAIHYQIRLGESVDLISTENVNIVDSQIAGFKSAIAEWVKTSEVKLNNITVSAKEKIVNKDPVSIKVATKPEPASDKTNEEYERSTKVAAQMRQTVILDKIRQSGNCRLKDILDLLPGTSERTLRYDLQSLVEQGLLERTGGGGPGTYYELKPAPVTFS